MDTEEMLQRLRAGDERAFRFIYDQYYGLLCRFANQMLHDTAVAEEIVDVNYQGEEMEVGFNVTYILDVLNALKCQQVRIRLTDASSSCLIENSEDASAEYVIMPMRL